MARKRHEEEHENHERWLVSYADFITLLFAFFVVMYAISSVNEGKYRVLSDSLTQAFRTASNSQGPSLVAPSVPSGAVVPVVVARQPQKNPALEAKREQYRQRMRSMAEAIKRVLAPLVQGGQVRVTEAANGITIEINASALFNPGEAQLGAEATRALRAVAEVIAQGDFPIKVEGHTDSTPIATPSFPSNWELSAVRASSVVRLFVMSGVTPGRLSAAGYGDQRPVDSNATADGRARNRRVTILVEAAVADESYPLEDASDPQNTRPERDGPSPAQSSVRAASGLSAPVQPETPVSSRADVNAIPPAPITVRSADGSLGVPANVRLVPVSSSGTR